MLTDEDREALCRAITTADTIVFVAPGGATERAVEQIVARHVAAALNEAAGRIEARRGERWQRHLRQHPYADGRSCPGDYAAHDAYRDAARIVRAAAPPP